MAGAGAVDRAGVGAGEGFKVGSGAGASATCWFCSLVLTRSRGKTQETPMIPAMPPLITWGARRSVRTEELVSVELEAEVKSRNSCLNMMQESEAWKEKYQHELWFVGYLWQYGKLLVGCLGDHRLFLPDGGHRVLSLQTAVRTVLQWQQQQPGQTTGYGGSRCSTEALLELIGFLSTGGCSQRYTIKFVLLVTFYFSGQCHDFAKTHAFHLLEKLPRMQT